MLKCFKLSDQLNSKIIDNQIIENAKKVLSNYFLSVAGRILIIQEDHKDYGILDFFDALELLNEAFEKASVILCNENPNMEYFRSFRDTKKNQLTSNHVEFLYYCISVFIDNFTNSNCSAEEYKAYHIVLNFCPDFAKAKEQQISKADVNPYSLWDENVSEYDVEEAYDEDLPF